MSCDSLSLTRLPRSLNESPDYDPAWRFLQVEQYLRARDESLGEDSPFILSSHERDSLIRAYFKFRTNAPTPRLPVCQYAQACHDSNARTSAASRIKAMVIAGLPTAEIARRLHTCAENIEAFNSLFFDVGEYLGDRTALAMILSPVLQESTAGNSRERVWLLAALHLGTKGLEYVMDQRVTLSTTEQQEISDAIHSILAEQTLQYAFSLRSKTDGGAQVMDAYHKSLEVRARNPDKPDDGKWDIFTAGLLRAAKDKMDGEAAENPAGGQALRLVRAPGG